MNKGILKVLPLNDLTDNQQVIVVDFDDVNNQKHFCIGRVEGLCEYKLRFWNTAKNDEQKPIWITAEKEEFGEFSMNYESRLAFLRNLVIEVSLNNTIPVSYSEWVKALRKYKIGEEVTFEENNGIAKLI